MGKNLVVVESPYADNNKTEYRNVYDLAVSHTFKGTSLRNIEYARDCMKDCLKRGEYPIASHLLYTQKGILDDTIPSERLDGIMAGLAWSDKADYIVVYTDLGVSEGMKKAIAYHNDNKKEIKYRSLYGKDK